ncbi:MAG: hypothetical protein ACMXYD_04860 [Candidatus Woesearchaeota archaeon]
MSNNFSFYKQERAPIIWQSLLLTTILIFWKYYGEQIQTQDLITTTILFFLCSLIVVLIHETGHKITAEKLGYSAQVSQFTAGIAASAILIFYSFARIPLIIANPLEIDADPRKRLGKRRQFENRKEMGFIAIGGIVASAISITFFYTLQTITGIQDLSAVAIIAGIHAISSLIPWELAAIGVLRFKKRIPDMLPGDGLLLLRWDVKAWLSTLTFITIFFVLSVLGVHAAFIIALALTAVAFIGYVIKLH